MGVGYGFGLSRLGHRSWVWVMGLGWLALAIAWNWRTLPAPTAARYSAEQFVGWSAYEGAPWTRSLSCVVSEQRARPAASSLPSADRLQNASIAWLGLGLGMGMGFGLGVGLGLPRVKGAHRLHVTEVLVVPGLAPIGGDDQPVGEHVPLPRAESGERPGHAVALDLAGELGRG